MKCRAHTAYIVTRPANPRRRMPGRARLISLAAVLCLLPPLSPFVAPAGASTLYTISGRGFGHGVGMSQYGAYGYAKRAGWNYRQILAHYYQRTNLSSVSNVTMRVLVRDSTSQTSLTSAARLSLYDERTRGRRSLVARHVIAARPYGSRIRVTDLTSRRVVGTYVGPVRFTPSSAPIRMLSANSNGQTSLSYRGYFRTIARSGRVRTVNHVPLESYLLGVVPREMPASWHMEALKAQAVAARSFAVAHRRSGGDFDVYATTASQYYGARSAEQRNTNRAVSATKGHVLRYGSTVISAYFHSTSGGKTENVEYVWGGSTLPWARGVEDRYDSISPYHSWRPLRYWPSQLDAKLGSYVKGALRDVSVTSVGASPRVRYLRIRGSSGTTSVRGSAVRSRLGLRSTWFSVRAMNIGSNARSVLYGRPVAIFGYASPAPTPDRRGQRLVAIKARRASWARWGSTLRRTSSTGRFYKTVRPATNTYYRSALGWAISPTVLVRVRVIISLNASTYTARVGQRIRLGGGVLPNHRGREVRVNLYSNRRWRVFARDRLNSQSRYNVGFTPARRGTYYFATTFASHNDHVGSSTVVRTITVR